MRTYKIDKLMENKDYLMTTRMKATDYSHHQPDTVVEDNYEYKSYKVKVTKIEEREDYWYVGYIPEDWKHGRFGYTRIYKEPREFGTIGLEIC